MVDANLNDLDPKLRPIAQEFLLQCNSHFTTKIIVTWRDDQDQDQAHMSGLSNASAGQSPHNRTLPDGTPASLAFDFAVFDEDGAYVTDGTDSRYATAGQIGQSLGLVWGGSWHYPDYDHLEMANWQTLEV